MAWLHDSLGYIWNPGLKQFVRNFLWIVLGYLLSYSYWHGRTVYNWWRHFQSHALVGKWKFSRQVAASWVFENYRTVCSKRRRIYSFRNNRGMVSFPYFFLYSIEISNLLRRVFFLERQFLFVNRRKTVHNYRPKFFSNAYLKSWTEKWSGFPRCLASGNARKTGGKPEKSDNSQTGKTILPQNGLWGWTGSEEDNSDIRFQLRPRICGQNIQNQTHVQPTHAYTAIAGIFRIIPT